MKLSSDEVKAIKRSLQMELKLINLSKKSPASLSKKERKALESILAALPDNIAEEREYKFNSMARNIIKRVVEDKLNKLVNHILPEYDVRKKNGQDVEKYVDKQNSFVVLLKGVIEKC